MQCRGALPAAAVVLVSIFGAGPQAAQGPAEDVKGFVLWPASGIAAAVDRLESTVGSKPLVFETIGNYPGHSIYLVLRGRTGQAEVHETEADLFVARKGRATLVIGGELVDGQAMPRKQRRGTSIRGGIRRELLPGDIVHIPIGVPHQLIIAPGERFVYDLVKFDEEPLTPQ